MPQLRKWMTLAVLLVTLVSTSVPVVFATSGVQSQTTVAPAIVQFASGSVTGGSATLVSLTFPQPAAQGDVLVICAGITSGNVVKIHGRAPFDSLETSFVKLAAVRSGVNQDNAYAKAWYGVVTGSGTDTVTFNYKSGPAGLYGYEISGSGINVSNFKSSTGSDRGVPTTGSYVKAYAPDPNSLVIACGGFFNHTGSINPVNPGLGYALDGSFFSDNAAEHLVPSSGSTSSPFSFSSAVHYWAEVSVSINDTA